MDDALERDVAQTEAATTDDKNEGGEMFRMVVDRLQQYALLCRIIFFIFFKKKIIVVFRLQQMGQTQRLHEAQVLTHQTRKDLDYLRRMSRYFEGPSAWLEIFLECTDIIIQVLAEKKKKKANLTPLLIGSTAARESKGRSALFGQDAHAHRQPDQTTSRFQPVGCVLVVRSYSGLCAATPGRGTCLGNRRRPHRRVFGERRQRQRSREKIL